MRSRPLKRSFVGLYEKAHHSDSQMTRLAQYIEAAERNNTRRSYASAIRHFEIEWKGFPCENCKIRRLFVRVFMAASKKK